MQCSLYNDTRDSIIARLNMLQASWGQGKAYFSNQAQPVAISPDNPLCRFKAVGYSVIPKHDNIDGLVAIVIAKKAVEVEAGKAFPIRVFQLSLWDPVLQRLRRGCS